MSAVRGRFAPSTTGQAHPGTLLAALLCWLDARSRGGAVLLRLEDLDPQRCSPGWRAAMVEALEWLGLDWDAVELQSEHAARHAAALDQLARAGRLYACRCSRATLRAGGVRAPDGSWRYANTCRAGAALDAASWRTTEHPLRVRLPDGEVAPLDEGGLVLSQEPATLMGDPVVGGATEPWPISSRWWSTTPRGESRAWCGAATSPRAPATTSRCRR